MQVYKMSLPEESLEILRQLGPSGVTGVHRDKQTHSRIQRDILSLEDEPLLLSLDRILNTLHLHGDHGEHFDWDAVELVEATPRSGLGKAFVDVANGL